MTFLRSAASTRRIACALALLAAAGGAAADIVVQSGTNCRSNGATSETAAGELINETYGVNQDDYVTYTCPVAMSRNPYSDSVTVRVFGATNFRSGQSFCMLRTVTSNGSVYHEKQSSDFATNDTTSKKVDDVVMTANLMPGVIANSVTLRCRLTSNSLSTNPVRPKNSIIMYWVEQ